MNNLNKNLIMTNDYISCAFYLFNPDIVRVKNEEVIALRIIGRNIRLSAGFKRLPTLDEQDFHEIEGQIKFPFDMYFAKHSNGYIDYIRYGSPYAKNEVVKLPMGKNPQPICDPYKVDIDPNKFNELATGHRSYIAVRCGEAISVLSSNGYPSYNPYNLSIEDVMDISDVIFRVASFKFMTTREAILNMYIDEDDYWLISSYKLDKQYHKNLLSKISMRNVNLDDIAVTMKEKLIKLSPVHVRKVLCEKHRVVSLRRRVKNPFMVDYRGLLV